MLRGFGAYSGVTLTGTYAPTPSLSNNVTVKDLAGAVGSASYWKLTVPAGQKKLTFRITGGSGNADIYVQSGSKPTTTAYICSATSVDNSDACIINVPAAGDYYVKVYGKSAYERLTLRGFYSD